MGWFRRKKEETYNEQLLREAGLADAGTNPAQPAFGAYIGAGARPAEWDVYTRCEAPGVAGDSVQFVALPEGDLIVAEEEGDADLSSFADAVEQHLSPPYRAIGRREEGAVWAVAASQIDVRRMERDGDEFEDVEGETVVRGRRLDGDLWEIQEDRL
jgi:hypothetical protein